MKRNVIIAAVILLVIGLGVGYYAYQNIYREQGMAVEQNQNLKAEDVKTEVEKNKESVIRQGEFVDGDAVHRGSGQALVVQTSQGPVLKLTNFQVTTGPDLFVYLSPNPPSAGLGQFASLGVLKSFSGEQVYSLPADHEKYKTVVIWCRAFGVAFAKAELK